MLKQTVYYLIPFAFLSCAVDSGNNGRTAPINDNGQDPVTINAELNRPPTITNLSISKNEAEGRLTFEYDLADEEENPIDISIWIIVNDEDEYEIPLDYLEGDVGYPVSAGDRKSGSWNYTTDSRYSNIRGESLHLRIIADDRFVGGLEDVIGLVKRDRIEGDLKVLEGVRHASANTELLRQSREYIRDHFIEYGLDQHDQNFNHLGTEGVNLIGTIHGDVYPNEYYIIDGHYDTILSTPGADDNASGTAGMLEAMRVLSQFNFERGIKFIGFDLEEIGLRGSRYYARNKEDSELIKGLINFEMIGYTCDADPECSGLSLADTSIYVIRSSFANALSNEFLAIGAEYVPGLNIDSTVDDGDPNFRRSDHAPFWDIGVDALFITDGANFRNPHYHQGSDTFETLDTEFATEIVQVAVGTIAKLAGFNHTDQITSDQFVLD